MRSRFAVGGALRSVVGAGADFFLVCFALVSTVTLLSSSPLIRVYSALEAFCDDALYKLTIYVNTIGSMCVKQYARACNVACEDNRNRFLPLVQ